MLFSVYATDPPTVRAAVVEQACADGAGASLFTSLHLPEAGDLDAWIAWMAEVHRDRGVSFWADVSPGALEQLGGDLGKLGEAGVVGVRLDYGFTTEAVGAIARRGMRIAVNASTITAEELDALANAGVDVVGWHNFYPRPGTGLSREYYLAQSELFTARGLPLLAFIPGETSRRAPLHLGLPTLEAHRYRNAYVTACELSALTPGVKVVCAEGTLRSQHLEWVRRVEDDGVVTLPLVGLVRECEWLLERDWRLRVEQSGVSQRLVGTRGHTLPTGCVPADALEMGSVQIDTLGRYFGEVQLMVSEQPLDAYHLHLGDVAAPYRGLVTLLRGGETIRLIRG